MKIKHLSLENYRGFEKLEVEFPEAGSAVFIGVNGAGKSSILAAIKMVFAKIVEREKPVREFLTEWDVRLGALSAEVELVLSDSSEKYEYKVNRNLNAENGEAFEVKNDYLYMYFGFLQAEGIKDIAWHEIDFPIFCSYSPNRILAERVEHSGFKRYPVPQMRSFEAAFDNRLDFNGFIEWFVEEENNENREKVKRKDLSYTNLNLDIVRQALQVFFENFSSEEYENLRVEERSFNKFTSAPSSLVITKSGTDLNLTQMSDGEKMAITVVGDIAHRLTLANPALKSKLQGAGIVLIDEIELHLHPSWQRSIIPALEATFPNIQFVVTTHSPQVLSSLKQENVFILEDFQLVKKTPHTFGRDTNSLLQDLFNVAERPERAKEEFRRLYRLMDDPEMVEEANNMLREMEGKYGSDDPEIIRARMHQEFMNEE
ncbi:MAG: AAA family ATPase [Phaeodactylibacter sp.]|nr:AAA family ATPase [Phaeodactylibacter sp.]